jgi:hypothetical protein
MNDREVVVHLAYIQINRWECAYTLDFPRSQRFIVFDGLTSYVAVFGFHTKFVRKSADPSKSVHVLQSPPNTWAKGRTMTSRFEKIAYIQRRLSTNYVHCGSVTVIDRVDPIEGDPFKRWFLEVQVGYRMFMEISLEPDSGAINIVVVHVDKFQNHLKTEELRYQNPMDALQAIMNRIDLIRLEFHSAKRGRKRRYRVSK